MAEAGLPFFRIGNYVPAVNELTAFDLPDAGALLSPLNVGLPVPCRTNHISYDLRHETNKEQRSDKDGTPGKSDGGIGDDDKS